MAFGGVRSGVLVNSTFSYNEATDGWSAVPTPKAPTPRSDFAFAFDPTTGRAVLFGGLTNLAGLAVSNQTWVFTAGPARWSQSPPGPAPAAREAAAFAIDPLNGMGILYGGWNRNYSLTGSLTYSDLWEYNLSTGAWSSISPTGPRPPPLEGASMVWDPRTLRVDMFGGCYPCSSTVWQFDPAAHRWAALATPIGAPAPRAGASWAFDPILGADLLFGGTDGTTTFNDTHVFYPLNDTWGTQTLPARPAARSLAASAFLDAPNNETWLLAGGQVGGATYSDLWRLSATVNVSLRVVNASSPLSPLAGAQVNLSGRRAGLTNPSGYLNLTQVNGVGSALNITDDPWYFPANGTVWLPPGRTASWTIALVPEPLGTVHVRVYDPGLSPLAGVFLNLSVDSVRINPVPAVTDGFGNASFHGVPPGRVNVTTSALDWRPAFVLGALAPGALLNVTVVTFRDPVLTVSVLGRLPSNLVVPLNSAQVILNGTSLGRTNSTGVLVAVTATLGLESLVAIAPDFYPGIQYIPVPFTGTANGSLVLQARPFGILPVNVFRSNDSFPIQGATVTAYTTVPLDFGQYALNNLTDFFGATILSLPAGTYAVGASAPGYFLSSNQIVFVSGGVNQPLTILLVPIPPGKVHFLIHDGSSGAAIAGANVTDRASVHGLTNVWGYYNVTNLQPGTYFFQVSAPRYLPNSTVVTVHSNDNLTVVVNLTLGPLILGSEPTWAFNLFPGGLDQLWPFLLIPLLLVVGSFVFASILRAARAEEASVPVRNGAKDATTPKPPDPRTTAGSAASPKPPP